MMVGAFISALVNCSPVLCWLSASQEFALTKDKTIRHQDLCLAVESNKPGTPVKLEGCQVTNQDTRTWEHLPDRGLRHAHTGLCLDSAKGSEITAEKCDPTAYSQRWEFSLYITDDKEDKDY